MKLTDQQVIQAITDALASMAIALSNQVDGQQLVTDLQSLADEAERKGSGASAGLIREIANTIASRTA